MPALFFTFPGAAKILCDRHATRNCPASGGGEGFDKPDLQLTTNHCKWIVNRIGMETVASSIVFKYFLVLQKTGRKRHD